MKRVIEGIITEDNFEKNITLIIGETTDITGVLLNYVGKKVRIIIEEVE